jgi:hypothetical protein
MKNGKVNLFANVLFFYFILIIAYGCNKKTDEHHQENSEIKKTYMPKIEKIEIDKNLEKISKILSMHKFVFDANKEIYCKTTEATEHLIESYKTKNNEYFLFLNSILSDKDMCNYLTITQLSNKTTYNNIKEKGLNDTDIYGFVILLDNPAAENIDSEKFINIVPFLDIKSCEENRSAALKYFVRPLSKCESY